MTSDKRDSGETALSVDGQSHHDAGQPTERDRLRMVEDQLVPRGISHERVLRAMATVPRHAFVPASMRPLAYLDSPLPIGHEQTISQPYIVAAMTEQAGIDERSRVLELGTGSGYATAILAEIAAEVYSIEIVPTLARQAETVLRELGYDLAHGLVHGRVHLRVGDGYQGWPEAAPFDAILVAAAPPAIPQPLIDQLAVGGKLIIPVGSGIQELRVLTRTPTGVISERLFEVRFVPMTGRAQGDDQ
jgi:protein-L-isoaspartate(D-aspartate) O-methyltransferase